MLAVVAVAVAAAAGCAAQRAEGALRVPLGLDRTETTAALRRFDFCPGTDPVTTREVFPECSRPGAGFAQAWVVAHYRAGRLVRLQRYERWDDPVRAGDRWNQLVERRGAASQGAREQLLERGSIPAGTRSWLAFSDGDALVGVYLLRPESRSEPSILEDIVPAVGASEDAAP